MRKPVGWAQTEGRAAVDRKCTGGAGGGAWSAVRGVAGKNAGGVDGAAVLEVRIWGRMLVVSPGACIFVT